MTPHRYVALANAELQREGILRPGLLDGLIERLEWGHESDIKHSSVRKVNTAVFSAGGPITVVVKTSFQARLISAREAAGWSQARLAAAVGLKGQSSIGNLEQRAGATTTKTVEIALALGVHPLWLATGEGPRELPSGVLDLSERERDLVLAFRYLSEEQKAELLNDVMGLAATTPGLRDVLRKEIGMGDHPARTNETAPSPNGKKPVRPRSKAPKKVTR